jgi:hypothetical protein
VGVEDAAASAVETEGGTTEEEEAMDMEAEEGAPHGTHNLTNAHKKLHYNQMLHL